MILDKEAFFCLTSFDFIAINKQQVLFMVMFIGLKKWLKNVISPEPAL